MPSRIRIISIPPREEVEIPDFVREAFVGLELPVVDGSKLSTSLNRVDWVGGNDPRSYGDKYIVAIEDVVSSLKAVDLTATEWFKNTIPYPVSDDSTSSKKPPIGKLLVSTIHFMIFEKESCEVIK